MLAKLHIRGNLSDKKANLAPTWGQLGPKLALSWAILAPRWGHVGAMLGQDGSQNRKNQVAKIRSKKGHKKLSASSRGQSRSWPLRVQLHPHPRGQQPLWEIRNTPLWAQGPGADIYTHTYIYIYIYVYVYINMYIYIYI